MTTIGGIEKAKVIEAPSKKLGVERGTADICLKLRVRVNEHEQISEVSTMKIFNGGDITPIPLWLQGAVTIVRAVCRNYEYAKLWREYRDNY